MKEFRGLHRKDVMVMNRETVREWLINNPDKSMKDCSRETGLSYITVRKHIKAILDEK